MTLFLPRMHAAGPSGPLQRAMEGRAWASCSLCARVGPPGLPIPVAGQGALRGHSSIQEEVDPDSSLIRGE